MRDMAPVHVYRVLDRDYPRALRELSSPPDPLCVRGELLPGPAIAMVGTRAPSAEAAAYTRDLAFRLARRGVTIWSGGALGIDAAAHRGALDADGITVAVIGTGLEHCYPPEHGPLYEKIVCSGGALVSPFEPSQHATLTTFPQRNGVLAAMTQATVVVQAPIKSGARSTARFARRLGRPLFVVPASPWDAQSAGNWAEVQLGARVLADDAFLFDLLGVPRLRPPPAAIADHSPAPQAGLDATTANGPSLPEHLPSECHVVFRMLSSTPLHRDDLCAESGLPTALVHAALLTLSLEAVLVEGPPGWFKRVTFRKDSI
jgi:DNA processing protein